MTKRNVMIRISTSRSEVPESLFDEDTEDGALPYRFSDAEMPAPTDLLIEGRLVTNRQRVELIYDEGEWSGMMGSVTSLGYDRTNPGLVSLMRTGTVKTALLFEEGKRHFSLYDTPLSSFQVCVHTLHLENALLKEKRLVLDYLVEVHGAQAERCRMTVTFQPSSKELSEIMKEN